MQQSDLQPAKKSSCLGKIFKGILIIFGLFIALGVLAAIFGPKTTTTAATSQSINAAVSNNDSTTAATVAAPTATPDWMAPPFEEICGSNSNLTEIQQEAKVKKMEGKKVVGWVGKVYDVKHDGDKYSVSVIMRDSFIKSRDLVISGLSSDSAVNLNVDQKISFDGTIQAIDVAFGVICNPITIADAKITPQ